MCPLGADGTAASRSVPFGAAAAHASVTHLLACRKPRVEQMGWQSLRRRSGSSGVFTSDRPVGGPSGASTEGSRRAPADQEATPRCRATVFSRRGRKATSFRQLCHVRDVGPPGSGSDYNHYEVSVAVANPRAVFGRDAIDMMGLIQSIATRAPGRARGASGSILAFPSLHPGTQRPQRLPFASAGHLFEQRRCTTSEPAGI